jgi:hypothetical protein
MKTQSGDIGVGGRIILKRILEVGFYVSNSYGLG